MHLMKRTLGLTLVLALAANADAGTTKGRGGGQSGDTTIGGNAQDGTPTGVADKGIFTYNRAKSSYTANLDCVRVDGSTTYFSGMIKVASKAARTALGILPGFTYIYGEFFDAGEPEQDSFELLLMNPDDFEEDPATYCETDRDGQAYDLTEGNLQVNN